MLFTMAAITLLSLTGKASAQTVGSLSDADGEAGGMVAENSPISTEVGIVAQADNATNYTLIDSAGGLFAIGRQSGVVTVATSHAGSMRHSSSHTIIVLGQRRRSTA